MHSDNPQFQRHKASLVIDILRPDKNLNERACVHGVSRRAADDPLTR
ncbi:MAG: hypothetical protein IPG64_20445 [Haliea sp.]|nr:hypothetical protein [Haliea sp.]